MNISNKIILPLIKGLPNILLISATLLTTSCDSSGGNSPENNVLTDSGNQGLTPQSIGLEGGKWITGCESNGKKTLEFKGSSAEGGRIGYPDNICAETKEDAFISRRTVAIEPSETTSTGQTAYLLRTVSSIASLNETKSLVVIEGDTLYEEFIFEDEDIAESLNEDAAFWNQRYHRTDNTDTSGQKPEGGFGSEDPASQSIGLEGKWITACESESGYRDKKFFEVKGNFVEMKSHSYSSSDQSCTQQPVNDLFFWRTLTIETPQTTASGLTAYPLRLSVQDGRTPRGQKQLIVIQENTLYREGFSKDEDMEKLLNKDVAQWEETYSRAQDTE